MEQNKFYVLRCNEEKILSEYSYNIYTGESQLITGVYGYPTRVYVGRNNNKSISPVFLLNSEISYSLAICEIIMYDNNETYIGYVKVDSQRFNKKIELLPKTYSVGVNIRFIESEDFVLSNGEHLMLSNSEYFKVTNESGAYNKKPLSLFYIGYEVTPYYKKIELKNKKENSQMFFRESLEGSIRLFGDDYKFVKSSSLEQMIMFAVCRDNQIIARNIFNKTDCKFDNAKCFVELKLFPKDIYTEILNKYENTYDIIKLAPKISRLTLTKRMAYQIYVAGSNNITTVANGTYWEEDVNEPVLNLEELQDKYHFAKIGDSFFEIHLSGFNYDINSTFIVDKNHNIWNATSEVTIWVDGEQKTYQADASIKFTKIYDEGEIVSTSDILLLSDGVSSGIITSDTRIFTKYDTYRIEIYTGRDGTGTKIYQSDKLYGADNGFLISPGEGKYPMTRIEQATPLKMPEPESFNIGDNIVEYGICCRIVCDIDQVQIGETTYTLYDLPSDDFVYSRANYKKCIGLIGLTLHQIRATSEKPTKYGMDDYGNYFTSNFLGYGALIYGRPIPISRSSWANTSIWVTFNENWTNFEAKFRREYTLKDAYDLADVISSMLAEIDPTIKHEGTAEYSQFLYSGTSPLNFDSARNGCRIYITPKSNVLKGNYDQAAQKADLTFKQLMDMLRDCFRCYWFIDNQNRFRIEHITYFLKGMSYINPTAQFDLTQRFDKFNKKKALYCQQEVEFDKSELSARYEFKWMDDSTDLFGNNSIEVKSKYIQHDKTEDITSDVFSSDVDLMLYAPDKFGSDGFALLVARTSDGKVPIGSTTQFKDSEYQFPYSATPQNFLASWLYLMRYYTYDMPATNISYDGIPSIDAMRVTGIKRCMKHEIEFPSKQFNIDINKLITTEIGNGYIEEMSTNLDTGMTKIELRYEPE